MLGADGLGWFMAYGTSDTVTLGNASAVKAFNSKSALAGRDSQGASIAMLIFALVEPACRSEDRRLRREMM